jgi:hypothetical protein
MNEISVATGMTVRDGLDEDAKLGVQIGEPIGHTRPPRVYLAHASDVNAGAAEIVTHIHEASGIAEAYEFVESSEYDDEAKSKTAEIIQQYIDDTFSDKAATLFFAGSAELTEDVVDRLRIPERIEIETDVEANEYIP